MIYIRFNYILKFNKIKMEGENIYINIEENNEKIFTIQCQLKESIKDLKERIKKKFGIPLFCQKLFFNNIELLDNKKLASYNINGESLLKLTNYASLKTSVLIKNLNLIYYLKASDSILELKKKIFEKENIPIEKIQILKSGNIIDDSKIIEDFMPDLNFIGNLLEIDKIKINIIDDKIKETIFVEPFSNVDTIYNQLKKSYDFRLKYNGNFLNFGKLLIQYNIKNGDNLELIKSKGKIEIMILSSSGKKMKVNVYLEQKIGELKEYISPIIGIEGIAIALKYDGMVLHNEKTFSEYDIENDDIIIASSYQVGGCQKN